MKLGFAVKVVGREGLKSNDSRRWQNNPHLSVSLAYLRDIFLYLRDAGIKMYRLSSDLAPYVTHPEFSQFHRQIEDCAGELAAIGEMARQADLRLSFHPAAFVVLNAVDQTVAQKSVADFEAQSRILDLMGLGAEAVMVTHVGGAYGDKAESMRRFVERYRALPEPVKRRLVLENDERNYTLGDAYAIHEQTGIRLVFDQLHELCNPTPGLTLHEALGRALDTWPDGQTPKIHYSTTRTAMVETDEGQQQKARLHEPRLSQHADLIDPFAFIEFVRGAEGLRDFDAMLECKAKDVALLRLRRHLSQMAPELIQKWHIE
ncbi:MAG: UV DNA damage repair endonuclease UvsE [Anaerolineae bacterium]|nr:UV DNA damage repair endonuclease UvsE [Anaerolineae bacterium]